jgi:hypothetical protein
MFKCWEGSLPFVSCLQSFFSGYFGNKLLLFALKSLCSSYFMLSAIAGMIGVCHHARTLFSIELVVLLTFFYQTSLESQSSSSNPLHKLG